MKTFKLFILTTMLVGLFSCSTNYTPDLDDDLPFDGETRSDTTRTDTTNTDGVGGSITDWDDGGKEDITMGEIPKD